MSHNQSRTDTACWITSTINTSLVLVTLGTGTVWDTWRDTWQCHRSWCLYCNLTSCRQDSELQAKRASRISRASLSLVISH